MRKTNNSRDTNQARFYTDGKWLKVADMIRRKYHFLCQECAKRGITKRGLIVHHIDWLTEEDYLIKPFDKCYGEKNLTLVCLDCHNSIHFSKQIRKGCYFDEYGNIQMKEVVEE